MIYTEYFVKGTQPTTVCPLHPAPSFFDRIAGVFGHDVGIPVPADQAGLPPPPPASTAGTAAPSAPSIEPAPADRSIEEKEPQKKKRGFWSRVFGVGRDDRDNNKKKKDEKKPGG
jgi:penicillin-binding protein 1B